VHARLVAVQDLELLGIAPRLELLSIVGEDKRRETKVNRAARFSAHDRPLRLGRIERPDDLLP
jgi:hypothetical protein